MAVDERVPENVQCGLLDVIGPLLLLSWIHSGTLAIAWLHHHTACEYAASHSSLALQ